MNILEQFKKMAALLQVKQQKQRFTMASWNGWRLPPIILERLRPLKRPDGSPVVRHFTSGARHQVFAYRGRDATAEAARQDMIARPKYYGLNKHQVRALKAGG